MVQGVLTLLLVTLAGIYLACYVFGYEITWQRKLVAAAVFAGLNIVPIPLLIPFIEIIVPAVGMYVALMDDTYQRSMVNKVFALTFLFAALGVLASAALFGT